MQHTAYWLLRWEARQPAAGMPSRTQNSSTMERVTDWSEVGVKALDDQTLEITMDHPLNTFDKTIAVKGLYPLRQDFVEKVRQR